MEDEKFGSRPLPEFVYVESEKQFGSQGEYSQFWQQYSESFEQLCSTSYPLSVRFICFLLALFLLCCLLAALPIIAVFYLIDLVSLFKVEGLHRNRLQIWNAVKRLLVIFLGMTLSVFSPPLGVGLILVFFLIKGQEAEENYFFRTVHSRFTPMG